MNGGRFDFDDGGSYRGSWEEAKAHGHGVCTGPDAKGEYAGAWHFGFEVSGVYTWPSGNTYEGQWQNGKRHGLGVETRGRWTYQGEWAQGLKGRYGLRQSRHSKANYVGTWFSGLHDGYGTETYVDGGTYKGQWLRGMRHGFGIRTSAPYGVAAKYRSRSQTNASLTSLRSDIGPEKDDKKDKKPEADDADEFRGGFVLRVRSDAPTRRRRSLSERSLAVKRSILSNLRIKKQHSTGDIHQRVTSMTGSLKSSGSTMSCTSDEDEHRGVNDLYFAPEERIEPNVVESYKGEWKNDKRSGYGVCERTDGVKYYGEWFNNRKHGYGVTTFKDGTKEEGRYKNNVLVCSTRRKGIMFVRSSRLREKIEQSVEGAKRAADLANENTRIARNRLIDHYHNHVSFESTTSANINSVPMIQYPVGNHQQYDGQANMQQQPNAIPQVHIQTQEAAFANPELYNQSQYAHNTPHNVQPILHNTQQQYGYDQYGQYQGPYEVTAEPAEIVYTPQANYHQPEPHFMHSPNEPSTSSQAGIQVQCAQPKLSDSPAYIPNNVNGQQPLSDVQLHQQQQAQLQQSQFAQHQQQQQQPQQQSSSAAQPPPPVVEAQPRLRKGRANTEHTSTMSLSDDHYDQYTMSRSQTANGPQLRRNRPSLTRQTEVLADGVLLNRRSTLAGSRDKPLAAGKNTNSVFWEGKNKDGNGSGADEERGSLPNLADLEQQGVHLRREDAARLASQRRQEAQRILEEEELLRANPLRYLYHPTLRNWLYNNKGLLLLIAFNVCLIYVLFYLLTYDRSAAE